MEIECYLVCGMYFGRFDVKLCLVSLIALSLHLENVFLMSWLYNSRVMVLLLVEMCLDGD
jgi:hypothetical protein